MKTGNLIKRYKCCNLRYNLHPVLMKQYCTSSNRMVTSTSPFPTQQKGAPWTIQVFNSMQSSEIAFFLHFNPLAASQTVFATSTSWPSPHTWLQLPPLDPSHVSARHHQMIRAPGRPLKTVRRTENCPKLVNKQVYFKSGLRPTGRIKFNRILITDQIILQPHNLVV